MKKNNNILLCILYFVSLCIILYVCRLRVVENMVVENMSETDISTENTTLSVEGGGSEKYGWGYSNNEIVENDTENDTEIDVVDEEVVIIDDPVIQEKKCSSSENIYDDSRENCSLTQGRNRDCRFSDITKNVNIDKYVLKSSVPPCPDMSQYAKKNQISPFPYSNEWIRKSEIPACPEMPNMDDWIRKSEVPNCANMECPKCPICPLAPTCPGNNKDIKVLKNTQKTITTYNKQLESRWEPKFDQLNNGYIDTT